MNKREIINRSIGLVSLTLLSAVLMSGCSKVGPDYLKPKSTKLPSSWEDNTTQNNAEIKEWWKLFNDETLNTLVEKTYAQNLDLRSAGLRILQARAALGISEGLLFPQQQTLSGSLAGVRNSSNSFINAGLNFDVGWEMDVWGKYARGIESSEATMYASIASYDDILVTIIAEVARNYINFRTAQERKAFAKSNIEIQERVTKMTEVQFNAGNVSELDMQQSLTQLYTTKALVPAFELSMIQSRNAIAILLGVLPQEVDPLLLKKLKTNKEILFNYTAFEQNQQRKKQDYKVHAFIPVAELDADYKINADLVLRRPDLKVAELQAQSQSARIGSAEAELYPHFTLFGSLGYNNNNTGSGWLSAGDAIGISAGPAFSWNIFQYGRIKNQIRVQDALFQESLNNYNKKVLSAVGEVSNAMNGYRLNKEQLVQNTLAIKATVRAFEISMTQYDNGMVTYQRLLSTVEKLIRNEDAYAQIKGSIALQVVFLYKALGGGWQMSRGNRYINEEDVEQMSKRSDWGDYLNDDSVILLKEQK